MAWVTRALEWQSTRCHGLSWRCTQSRSPRPLLQLRCAFCSLAKPVPECTECTRGGSQYDRRVPMSGGRGRKRVSPVRKDGTLLSCSVAGARAIGAALGDPAVCFVCLCDARFHSWRSSLHAGGPDYLHVALCCRPSTPAPDVCAASRAHTDKLMGLAVTPTRIVRDRGPSAQLPSGDERASRVGACLLLHLLAASHAAPRKDLQAGRSLAPARARYARAGVTLLTFDDMLQMCAMLVPNGRRAPNSTCLPRSSVATAAVTAISWGQPAPRQGSRRARSDWTVGTSYKDLAQTMMP